MYMHVSAQPSTCEVLSSCHVETKLEVERRESEEKRSEEVKRSEFNSEAKSEATHSEAVDEACEIYLGEA